jgi:hypothetical protein
MGAALNNVLCIVIIDTHKCNALRFASLCAPPCNSLCALLRVLPNYFKHFKHFKHVKSDTGFDAASSASQVSSAVFVAVIALSSIAFSGCVSVKTEHRVEPIQITMDVNVRLERELEDSFAALDARSREIAAKQTEKGSE